MNLQSWGTGSGNCFLGGSVRPLGAIGGPMAPSSAGFTGVSALGTWRWRLCGPCHDGQTQSWTVHTRLRALLGPLRETRVRDKALVSGCPRLLIPSFSRSRSRATRAVKRGPRPGGLSHPPGPKATGPARIHTPSSSTVAGAPRSSHPTLTNSDLPARNLFTKGRQYAFPPFLPAHPERALDTRWELYATQTVEPWEAPSTAAPWRGQARLGVGPGPVPLPVGAECSDRAGPPGAGRSRRAPADSLLRPVRAGFSELPSFKRPRNSPLFGSPISL